MPHCLQGTYGSWQLIGPGIRRRRQPVIAAKNFVTQQHRHSKGKHAVLSLRSAISTSTKWSCSEKRERWQGLEWSREVGADDGCRGWAPIGKWRMRRRLFRGLWHTCHKTVNSPLEIGWGLGGGGLVEQLKLILCCVDEVNCRGQTYKVQTGTKSRFQRQLSVSECSVHTANSCKVCKGRVLRGT